MKRAIITAASNKYFPSLINFIGSMKAKYPNHPPIYIYDLGLNFFLKKEIEKIQDIKILKIPHFINHWRSCYTWKTYILNTPISDSNFYIDVGCQILKPLDEIFEKIEEQGYFLVNQGQEVLMRDITPKEYTDVMDIDDEILNKEMIAAGIFGFKKESPITKVTEKLYQAGIAGLCLGFSKNEQWKNKGVNKNIFIRNCKMFRHDTTLLSILILKFMPGLNIEDVKRFYGEKLNNDNQLVWNLRMNYSKLEYINHLKLNLFSKIFIFLFLKAKSINKIIKSI